jgi:hypothetical protein
MEVVAQLLAQPPDGSLERRSLGWAQRRGGEAVGHAVHRGACPTLGQGPIAVA